MEQLTSAPKAVTPPTRPREEVPEKNKAPFVVEIPKPEVNPEVEPELKVKAKQKKLNIGREETPLLGRGGPQHKYLQNLIKKIAEDRGYRAVIEQPTEDGTGRIDVALLKGKKKIACEISVTTTPEHECGNVRKCLSAGYTPVIVLTSDVSHLRKIREAIKPELDSEQRDSVRFFLPEQFTAFLEEDAASSAGSETVVKGYKVKVNYKAVETSAQKEKREAIAKVIVQSMKRMEKDK